MLRIGTSGYSYEDWVGPFYPDGTQRGAMLAHYAGVFAATEVTSSYYRIPHPRTCEQMLEKVPAGFMFSVKAHRSFTHERNADRTHFGAFAAALAPLLERGQLACILLQFPFDFRNTADNIAYLQGLFGSFEARLVVEFRHRSWQTDETFETLRRYGVGYCSVDVPRLKGLPRPVTVATSPLAYVRLHGRNADRWWRQEEPRQRYDYLYSGTELAEWAARIKELGSRSEDVYVFFNNHYRAQAARNANVLIALLRGSSGAETATTTG
ncbi:MAG: DUF72 domain-containing protein [Candidatus Schekmanbacteria bacterium]|nr:DUF72 domain-containing protein [Candidatus Schekmanbacteria bacterium]